MTKYEQTLEALKGRGLRLTPQRLIILSIVAQGPGHLGVDEIHRDAKARYPFMDVATVYRTLHLLKKLGVVTEVPIGDRHHYELTDPQGRHHHMVCRDCGGAYNLAPDYLEEFRRTLVHEFGFEPDLDHFTVSGICSKCQVEH